MKWDGLRGGRQQCRRAAGCRRHGRVTNETFTKCVWVAAPGTLFTRSFEVLTSGLHGRWRCHPTSAFDETRTKSPRKSRDRTGGCHRSER
jgi:hypothetical protein